MSLLLLLGCPKPAEVEAPVDRGLERPLGVDEPEASEAPLEAEAGPEHFSPYPFNGSVENRSTSPVLVYDCDSRQELLLRPVGQEQPEATGRYLEDWDFYSPAGSARWFQVGPEHLVLTDDNLTSAGCETWRCKPCGWEPEHGRP